MDANYKTRNKEVLNEVEALFEKIQYGVVRIDFSLHNTRITKIHVYGSKRIKFDKQGRLKSDP